MTWHLDDYRCKLLRGILRHSFQETSPRNTAENTAKHRGDGVGSVVDNHRGGGESSVTVTTLIKTVYQKITKKFVINKAYSDVNSLESRRVVQ